ncbi:tail fiber assembly protein [Escherichia coli]|uniref:tail fiber assembly protein n=1 Tax=Enterobacteriaceae TaxID=543 RepID=UPI000F5E2A47|nr:tail fiber assembly protein [Escherichia coli]EEQ0796762.1 tail fiber assembly protein [Salmonella enterica subsp. enterica serovar Lattenkamp]EHA2602878.1 tail fiber assembly protein [Salmonella enterica]EHT2451960.1 tail fiber assembly protein [Escherichia fergusonii]EFP0881886.1 tail fiber assembly protein [Escherichia coli]EKG5121479.1 tail fiber assembly protein [Escherichia coli]
MMDMKNFVVSEAATDEEKFLAEHGAIILRDEEGREWYTSQQLFKDDTFKIMYDSEGVVKSITTDVSTLFPVSCSVAEVNNIPEGIDIYGGWIYSNGRISAREYTESELIARAEQEKQSKISQANEYMYSKQWPGKAAIGRLRGDELTQYNLWLDYFDALNAVDVRQASVIIWPEQPKQ